MSFPWDALGRGASPGLSEGRAEGVGQLLGESETAGHEGVDHDHVPWFNYSSEMRYLQILFRYCSVIDMISSDIDMICDMSLNEGLDEMGSNISPCSDYIISSNMFKCWLRWVQIPFSGFLSLQSFNGFGDRIVGGLSQPQVGVGCASATENIGLVIQHIVESWKACGKTMENPCGKVHRSWCFLFARDMGKQWRTRISFFNIDPNNCYEKMTPKGPYNLEKPVVRKKKFQPWDGHN